MARSAFVPLPAYQGYSIEEMKRHAAEFYSEIRRRRTVREYSNRPVPREVIEDCLRLPVLLGSLEADVRESGRLHRRTRSPAVRFASLLRRRTAVVPGSSRTKDVQEPRSTERFDHNSLGQVKSVSSLLKPGS
jgi:hypothetical protein